MPQSGTEGAFPQRVLHHVPRSKYLHADTDYEWSHVVSYALSSKRCGAHPHLVSGVRYVTAAHRPNTMVAPL